jgi:glycosyltransferase involved in cell wall biosynthesis
MKVILLTRRLDDMPTNGFERYAHNLRAGLRDRGIDALLPCQRSLLPVRPSGSLISPPYYDLFLPALRLVEGCLDAEVVHALTDSQAFFFPFLRGRKVVTLHHVDKTPPGSAQERIFCRFYALGTRLALRYADHFICISEQTKNEVMEAYGIPAEMITVIPQAIPASFRPHAIRKEGWTVGYVGALKKRKNVEALLRAFALARSSSGSSDLRLVICGEGPDEAVLRRMAEDLGGGVEFRGLVPEDRLVDTYCSFNVFAFPSLQEGFGFPIVEAQACGVPVLTLEGSMVPEEVTRYALKCRGEQGMAEAMIRLHDDPMLYSMLREEGLQHAATFSVGVMAERTAVVYQGLLRGDLTRKAWECGSL